MPNLTTSPSDVPPDALANGVIRFTAWALIVGGLLFATILATISGGTHGRIVLNLAISAVGALALVQVYRGHPKFSAGLLVHGTWALTTLIVWHNGGLAAPNLMSYAALLIVSAWLLGTQATYHVLALTVVVFVAFYLTGNTADPEKLSAMAPEAHLVYLIAVLGVSAGITLLSRHSYRIQLDALRRTSSELANHEAELQKLSRAVEQSPESIIITNLEPRIEYVNEAFVTHTGYSRAEAIGQNPSMLRSGKTPAEQYQELWNTLAQGSAWRGEFVNRTKQGDEVIESAIIAPIRGNDGTVTHYVAIEQDITHLRHTESEIHRLANFDSLTGLPNRALLIQRLEHNLALGRRKPRQFALLLLNVDRFKTLNDARGQSFGDAFLADMAQRLAAMLREGDTLARLAADEFGILVLGLGHQVERAAPHALAVAEKIRTELRRPFHVNGSDDILVTASIGVALCPDGDHDTPQDILRRAETALHRAKDAGGGRFAFFDAAMGQAAEQRFSTERELRQGIAAGELRLYLQPQVDHQGRRIGAEALVRWRHPTRGLVPPVSFIPVAEESDLIVELGDWVTQEACRLIAAEEAAGRILELSINVSPRHFHQEGFVNWLTGILRCTGADPTRLTLEVTEGLVIADINDVVVKMNTLASLGVRFSIDDFGTGYSSLAYLKRLPIHELKIDRTFIKDLATDPDDAVLVETILSIARHLRLKVVAEGVETVEQAAFLNARGPIIHQGYLFGRPDEAGAWLARWREEDAAAAAHA